MLQKSWPSEVLGSHEKMARTKQKLKKHVEQKVTMLPWNGFKVMCVLDRIKQNLHSLLWTYRTINQYVDRNIKTNK